MGSKNSSIITHNQYQIDIDEWREQSDLDDNPYNQFGQYRLLRNIKNPEKFICEYSLPFTSKKDLVFYEDSFLWRLDQPFISKTLYLMPQIQKSFCGSNYTALVYIQAPKNRLSDFKDIPYPDNLYCLAATLQGYHKIYQNIGNVFPISEQQVAIDEQGVIKVWLNKDLSRNYPQEYDIEPMYNNIFEAESQMVKDIIRMIAKNTDESTQPSPTFLNYFQKYIQNQQKQHKDISIPNIKKSKANRLYTSKVCELVTFEEALNILQQYASHYSEQGIPQNFTSVIQIYHNENNIYNDYNNHEQVQIQQKDQYDDQIIYQDQQDIYKSNQEDRKGDKSWQNSSGKVEFINVNPSTLYNQVGDNQRFSQFADNKHLTRSSRNSNIQKIDNGHQANKYNFNGQIIEEAHESSNMNYNTDRKTQFDIPNTFQKTLNFNGDYGYHNDSTSKVSSNINKQSSVEQRFQKYSNNQRDQSSSFSYLRNSGVPINYTLSPRNLQHNNFPYINNNLANNINSSRTAFKNQDMPNIKKKTGHNIFNYNPYLKPHQNRPISKPEAPIPPQYRNYQKQNYKINFLRPKTQNGFNFHANTNIPMRIDWIPNNNQLNQNNINKNHHIHIKAPYTVNTQVQFPKKQINHLFRNQLYSIHQNSQDDHYLANNISIVSSKNDRKYRQQQINKSMPLNSMKQRKENTRYYRKSKLNNTLDEQIQLDPEIAKDLQIYKDKISKIS